MTDLEFRAWPKTPRLFRDMIVTEKIDGTNAAVGIIELAEAEAGLGYGPTVPGGIFRIIETRDIGDVPAVRYFGLYAQSRKRLITPGKTTDNYGFAGWVEDNAADLVTDLGPGLHYGEWWGGGIQRGYGLAPDDKRFSLFNVSRYGKTPLVTPGLDIVPIVRLHTFSTVVVSHAVDELREHGSYAAPGYLFPEGVVVYHTAAGQVFKVTLENDDRPKGQDG